MCVLGLFTLALSLPAWMPQQASAQEPPKLVQPEPQNKIGTRGRTPLTDKTTKPAARQPAKSGGCGGKAATGALVPNPNAKYSCPESVVELPPVWSGEPLIFTFKIKNTGTEDLHIRAKGG